MTSLLFDPAVVEFVRDLAPIWLVLLLTALSFLGSTFYQLPVLIAFYTINASNRALTWLGIVLGSYSFRSLLKHANDVDRPPVDPPLASEALPWVIRPAYEHPAEIATTSFPSGHAIAATVLWGLVVMDTSFRTRGQRFALAAGVITIVAVSRVVLGAHYVEDVVAGVFFGGLFLWGVLWLRNRSANPVTAVFTLVFAISLLVAVFSVSTTGSAVLGTCVGVLAVHNAGRVRSIVGRLQGRTIAGAFGITAVGSGAVLAVSNIIMPLAVIGLIGGAACYWVPRQSPVRRRVSTVVPGRFSRSAET